MTDRLVGLAEIQEMYDVPKSTALSWTRQHTFPPQHTKLAMGPIWLASVVTQWHRERFGPQRPRPVSTRAACQKCGDTEVASVSPISAGLGYRCSAGHMTIVKLNVSKDGDDWTFALDFTEVAS